MQFFTREDRGYRISPDLRASVVFSVHDVLADPPFARLDFVSCQNLLIYLLPHYIHEGKSYLTIGFGCTGGHHRSGMIADQIRKNLSR